MLINICICTYKRAKVLLSCLESLALLQVPKNVQIVISVIDNDHLRSAEKIVSQFREQTSLAVFYHCEINRGIPFARNRALVETLSLEADYLAFIDDDEWTEPLWLHHLYNYAKSQSCDVIVSGAVISDLPRETPKHIAGLFNKKHHRTGANLTSCATNNVLIPVPIITKYDLKFDETNAFSGGEDTKFFYLASQSGAVIHKCAEAIVHEIIPANRVTLRWLSQRKYSSGITVAWRKMQSGRSRLSIAISSIFSIILGLLGCGVLRLVGCRLKSNKAWLKTCRYFGVLVGIFGVTVESYRNVDGS